MAIANARSSKFFDRMNAVFRRQLDMHGVEVVIDGLAVGAATTTVTGIVTPVSAEDTLVVGGFHDRVQTYVAVHRDDVTVAELVPGLVVTIESTEYSIVRTLVEPAGDAEVKIYLEGIDQ